MDSIETVCSAAFTLWLPWVAQRLGLLSRLALLCEHLLLEIDPGLVQRFNVRFPEEPLESY